MGAAVRAKGVQLRPHDKAHKLPGIAALQRAADAAGLTVAMIGEADGFAVHGAADIFLAYPLWVSPRQAERLRRLSSTAWINTGVDPAAAAAAMGKQLGDAAGSIAALVETNSGHHRSGVRTDAAAAVARAAAQVRPRVEEVCTFPGHSYAGASRARPPRRTKRFWTGRQIGCGPRASRSRAVAAAPRRPRY